MDAAERRAHWDRVYRTKPSGALSWYQREPTRSLELLRRAGLAPSSCLIDIGAGDSTLIDHLVARGLSCLTVLDVSGAALERARRRLGPRAVTVRWVVADVTGDWSVPPQDFWHDRAVFHFLTDPTERARYVLRLRDALKPGGAAVIATFGIAGPPTCSGLPVARYSPHALHQEIGADFQLVEHATEDHRTPAGATQPFVYCVFRAPASGRLDTRRETPSPSV